MDLAYLLETINVLTLSLGNLTEGEEADNEQWSGDFHPLLVEARQITPSLLLTSCCGHGIG